MCVCLGLTEIVGNLVELCQAHALDLVHDGVLVDLVELSDGEFGQLLISNDVSQRVHVVVLDAVGVHALALVHAATHVPSHVEEHTIEDESGPQVWRVHHVVGRLGVLTQQVGVARHVVVDEIAKAEHAVLRVHFVDYFLHVFQIVRFSLAATI